MPYLPTIGAEFSRIDLRRPSSDDQVQGIRATLLDRKVILFRDQEIATEQYLKIVRNFGTFEVHPCPPHKDRYPEVLAIIHDQERPRQKNGWHSE